MADPLISRVRRAVGYCRNTDCDDYGKGVFLMNHEPAFFCPKCRFAGSFVGETYATENNEDAYREVRVEFNYNPETGHFQGVAIIKDASVEGPSNVYTLYSPLVRTDKRALKVAEGLLSNLQRVGWAQDSNGSISVVERILDFDKPREVFVNDCTLLRIDLEHSALASKKPATLVV